MKNNIKYFILAIGLFLFGCEEVVDVDLNKNQSYSIISFDLNDIKMGEYILEANDKVIIKSEKEKWPSTKFFLRKLHSTPSFQKKDTMLNSQK